MKITATQTLTDKEGYDALLYFLENYYELTQNTGEITDILSRAEYFWGKDEPADIGFWHDWLKAIEKAKTQGTFPIKVLRK